MYAAGSELKETMPMWRVQTEGYLDEKGMLIGVVAHNLDGSPDGEFIAAGENSKGPDAMAIGRQGSYLHWGFAASPTYMTDEAKLVFVNAIHYINKFEGQLAFERTEPVQRRDSIDSMFYDLSEKGNTARKANYAKAAVAHEKSNKDLRERQEQGEKLTELQKARLDREPPSWKPTDALKRVPEKLRDEFGDDIPRYVKYYKENRPYFYGDPAEWYGPLQVDTDAKELGIANSELKLLDKCIALLNEDPKHEAAIRILKRYTGKNFELAEQWRNWLEQYRTYLIFSESSGYKFIVNVNQVIADGKQHLLQQEVADSAEIQTQIDRMIVEEPEGDQPVTFSGTIVPISSDNSNNDVKKYRVIVRFKIMDGWHLYSFVPKAEAYVPTTLKLENVKGLVADGAWTKSPSTPTIENPRLLIWENECVFSKDLTIDHSKFLDKQLELSVDYQVCNEQTCLPITSETIQLQFERN